MAIDVFTTSDGRAHDTAIQHQLIALRALDPATKLAFHALCEQVASNPELYGSDAKNNYVICEQWLLGMQPVSKAIWFYQKMRFSKVCISD